MYNAAKANQGLFRVTACLVALIYAYFGFVAALHHNDGYVPTGRTLTFHAAECTHPHPEMSADSGAPECGVCEFLASLQYPASAVTAAACEAPAIPSVFEPSNSLHVLLLDTLYSPRGPPRA